MESRLVNPHSVCENCGCRKEDHDFHHNELVCPRLSQPAWKKGEVDPTGEKNG